MIVRQLSVTPGGVGSDYGKALTALTAAVINNGAATTGGHTGTKPDLAGALFVMWSEGGLHRCLSFKGPAEVPDGNSYVKAPLKMGHFATRFDPVKVALKQSARCKLTAPMLSRPLSRGDSHDIGDAFGADFFCCLGRITSKFGLPFFNLPGPGPLYR